jgi:ATP dependent DNA ligase C terminal region
MNNRSVRGTARSPNQRWSEPSIWISSPTCSRRSRGCWMRLRSDRGSQMPAYRIQPRNVSRDSRTSWRSPSFSAASVGPKVRVVLPDQLDGMITNDIRQAVVRRSTAPPVRNSSRRHCGIASTTDGSGTRRVSRIRSPPPRSSPAAATTGPSVSGRFTPESEKDLRARLKPLVRKTQPYAKKIAHRGIWVEPSLLAEIEYRAKCAEGKLRHPFFKGIREDTS